MTPNSCVIVSALLDETRSDLLYDSRSRSWCVLFSWSDALPKMTDQQIGQIGMRGEFRCSF